MATSKKVTKASESDQAKKAVAVAEPAEATTATKEKPERVFTPTPESAKKAKTLRIFAILAWAVAIGLEVVAILLLRRPPITMWLMIVLIVGDLALAILGSQLWKQANRLDPASEKDKFRFFVQNQLGALISAIAFLPLVILILTNKDLQGKQKGILSAVAIVALVAAVLLGTDFNPPSQEQYAEQTQTIMDLTGVNQVYWTEHGSVYHIYDDCYHINSDRTTEIFSGTVAEAHEYKNITDLCKTCAKTAAEDPQYADLHTDNNVADAVDPNGEEEDIVDGEDAA